MNVETAWRCLESGPGAGGLNMALDEALLEAMPGLGGPVLRFYGWREPAATFGYFQPYAGVEALTSLRPLLRRPTGGGLVPHDRDWTYSVAVPPAHEWYSLPAIESYRRMHEWIRAAFARIGMPVELAPAVRRAGAGQCFAGHERLDVLWRGKKIAGAAQRRRRDGLLIQGSVQPPPGAPERALWQAAMRAAAETRLGARWTLWAAPESLRRRADELIALKYSRPEYHRKK